METIIEQFKKIKKDTEKLQRMISGDVSQVDQERENENLSDCCGYPLDITKTFCSSCGEHA